MSHFGTNIYYTQTCTGTSARMGHPILALVPVWGRCQFGVTTLLLSSSTGRPVPALGATRSLFEPSSSTGHPMLARCQYGDVRVPVPALDEKSVPVPALGRCQHGDQHICSTPLWHRLSAGTGTVIGPSSGTGTFTSP